jgi:hypothetical protein
LRGQLFQQRLRLLQIAHVEAFVNQPVNQSQQFGRFLVAPQALP